MIQIPNRAGTALILLALACPSLAHAGTDATFGGVVTLVSGWMTGSLGVLVSLVAVAAGTLMTVIRASAIPVIAGVGVALAMQTSPGVISGIVTADIAPDIPSGIPSVIPPGIAAGGALDPLPVGAAPAPLPASF